MKAIFKTIIVSIITLEAKLILKKHKPKIIAVIGSVGKTTTKDAIYTAIGPSLHVRKSQKTLNTEVGIPLTIVGCENGWLNPLTWLKNIFHGIYVLLLETNYPDWLIIEVGADRPGDISNIARWLKPDTIVVTRFPDIPVHVEYFVSPEELIKEKCSIIEVAGPETKLVLNGDDPKVRSLKDTYNELKTTTFGLEKNNNFVASNYQISQLHHIPTGIRFKVNHDGKSIPIHINGALGRQHIFPSLAAMAVGTMQGINLLELGEALSNQETPPGRMRLIPGIKKTIIIDDSYNSSPVAVDEALNTLDTVRVDGKKIVVLGDMLELGKFSVDEHKRVGKAAAKICDLFITIGFRARDMAQGALLGGLHESKILQYEDAQRAGKELESFLEAGDIVLVKGSQSIRTERVVEEIMRDPQNKKDLLVRQEDEWIKR